MREPSIRTSRLVIAAGLAAVVLVGGAGFLLGRQTAPRPPVPPPAASPPTPAPAAPRVERLLHRADLIALSQIVADAWSTGEAPPPELQDAAGRKFELVLPFGCNGPAGPGERGPMQWSYDAGEERLRVSVAPVRWQAADWGQEEAAGRPSEGFWVARPWSSAERCPGGGTPPAPAGTEPVTLTGQSLAVAQSLPADSESLLARGGRPLEIVQRVPRGEFDGTAGFRLRITGRIERDPQPMRCTQPGGSDQRPICMIAVRMDEIRIENGADGHVLGRWPVASGR